MPSGRQIVSDCESESYRVSEYIDLFLSPLATNHPSYIKDTHDFLKKIEQIKIPQNSFFVTLDVDSLYTNINNKEGLAAVAEVLAKTKHRDLNFSLRPDKEIMDLLKLSLENNDFILMMIGIFKLQTQQWAKNLTQLMQTYSWLNGRKKHLKRHEHNH